jgi:hypothetical protein
VFVFVFVSNNRRRLNHLAEAVPHPLPVVAVVAAAVNPPVFIVTFVPDAAQAVVALAPAALAAAVGAAFFLAVPHAGCATEIVAALPSDEPNPQHCVFLV